MDINRSNFWPNLVSIIKAISYSHSIAIDLEMTGIATRETEERINPTLLQVYEGARQAATAFTILQVGLTCIFWDEEEEAYTTKSFNIPLAPNILGGDKAANHLARQMDREIGFSSKTIAFLQDSHFKFGDVFDMGVPYLSAAEASNSPIIDFLENKQNSVESHVNIRDCPQETIRFYQAMRNKIQTWINAQVFEEKRSPSLTIENPYHGRFHRLQKRLIHQLVETEFFEYRVQKKPGTEAMEIVHKDYYDDERLDARTKFQRRQAVSRQTGFRYIWDAITGARFADKIDPELIVGQHPEKIIELRRELSECEMRIKARRPIVVGHHMLYDLCFLMKTFVGALPQTVTEFLDLVQDKLPRIVDTKYLFTRGSHEMMPDRSLEECFKAMKDVKVPAVAAQPLYGYDKPAPHQAGYDSYMTAVVYLKKSCQLSLDRQGLDFVSREDPAENEYIDAVDTSLTIVANATGRRLGRDGPPRVYGLTGRPASAPSLLTENSSLLDDDGDSLAGLVKFEPLRPSQSGALSTSVANLQVSEKKLEKKDERLEECLSVKIPEWEDGIFWKRYGNRVRIGQSGLMLYTGKLAKVNSVF